MVVSIFLSFGWAYYMHSGGLNAFLVILFFLGLGGGNFAIFSLWLPEQYGTAIRASAFAFTTSIGRFVGAIVTFIIGGMVKSMGTLGTPVAWTAVAFIVGLLVIPAAFETKGEVLPD